MIRIRNKILRILILILIVLFVYCIKVNAFTIVLDPGHGGSDPGAINTKKNIKEADVNYKIASYLSSYLNRYENVKVLMSRTASQYKTLEQRADVALNNRADLLLSIHINSAESGTPTGACTYVTYRNDFDKYKKNCTELSHLILNNLSKLGIKNNGVKTRICKDNEPKWMYADGTHADYYGIIRYCMKGTKGDGEENEIDISSGASIPVVLVEHCYIINGDEKYIDSDADIQKIAKCDLDAIVAYYHLKQKPQTIVDIKNTNININTANKSYTGNAIKTSITIKDGSYQLIEGIDYIVSYKNNKNLGTATVTINGKGNYRGTVNKDFKIVVGQTKNVIASAQSTNSITVKWTKDSAITGYEIYSATSKNGKYKKVATITKNSTTSYKKTGLTAGKTYYFKVRAYKTISGKKNYGSYSTVLTTTTKTKTPTISKVTAGTKKATIKWKKVTGATGYEIYMSTSKNGKYSKVSTITKNSKISYTKTGLTKIKTYYFKIRTYRTVNGKKVYSSYSKVKSIKIKK